MINEYITADTIAVARCNGDFIRFHGQPHMRGILTSNGYRFLDIEDARNYARSLKRAGWNVTKR